MKEKNTFWKRLRSIKNIAAVLAAAFGIIGIPLSFWFGHSLEILSAVVAFLGADALLTRLDTMANIEEDIKSAAANLAEIKTAVQNVEMDVISDDTTITERILKLSDQVRLKEAQILSSGLTSRQILIAKLLQKGISVQVLIQDPSTALDKEDPDRIRTALKWVKHHSRFIEAGLFDARYHVNVSTVRAIILTEAMTEVKHIYLSWYHYEDRNTKVYGDTNPTIHCTTLSKQGSKVYEWLRKIYERNLRESRKITAKDYAKI